MKQTHRFPIVIAMDIDDFLTSMQVDELSKRVWRDSKKKTHPLFVFAPFDQGGKASAF